MNQSTIDSTETKLDPTCTEADFVQQLYFNVFCRRQFIDSTINAIGDACGLSIGFGDFGPCGANEDGQYCPAIPDSETILRPADRQASRACTNTSVCDPLCALNNGILSLGCCFIDLFNDTETQPDWLTFEFWQQCDLTSPGFCELMFNDAPYDSGVSPLAPSSLHVH